MDNKTYFIKTTFWTPARVIVPIEAKDEEEARTAFTKGAEAYFGVEIRDLVIEDIADDLAEFESDLRDDSIVETDEEKKLH